MGAGVSFSPLLKAFDAIQHFGSTPDIGRFPARTAQGI
jgi:hypothetical protein